MRRRGEWELVVEWSGTVVLTTPRLLLRTFRRDDLPLYGALNADPEVAWRLACEHWGHGYATEAATGWLDHAFGTLNLPRVISMTDAPNLRSLAVMRRLGMVFDHEAEIQDMGTVFQAVVYVITAEQWRSSGGGAPGGSVLRDRADRSGQSIRSLGAEPPTGCCPRGP